MPQLSLTIALIMPLSLASLTARAQMVPVAATEGNPTSLSDDKSAKLYLSSTDAASPTGTDTPTGSQEQPVVTPASAPILEEPTPAPSADAFAPSELSATAPGSEFTGSSLLPVPALPPRPQGSDSLLSTPSDLIIPASPLPPQPQADLALEPFVPPLPPQPGSLTLPSALPLSLGPDTDASSARASLPPSLPAPSASGNASPPAQALATPPASAPATTAIAPAQSAPAPLAPAQPALAQPAPAQEAALASPVAPVTPPGKLAGEPFIRPVKPAALPNGGPGATGDRPRIRPFQAAAFGLTASTLGAGGEVAIPVASTLNLRVGGSYLRWQYPFNIDGIDYDPGLKFTSGRATIDWFPHHGAFHISAGALYFRNTIAGSADVVEGQTFTLGGVSYINSVDDPIHGKATVSYGKQIAPMLLLGFGNLLPRNGRHLSMPFEFGGAYMESPTLKLDLSGTACTNQGCFNAATDPEVHGNLVKEVNSLQSDLHFLQIYPVVSLGLACRF